MVAQSKDQIADLVSGSDHSCIAAVDGTTVQLALDSSVLWNRYVIVRVSLVYRGRALPLAWKVVEQGSASVGFSDYAPLLRAADAAACPAVVRFCWQIVALRMWT